MLALALAVHVAALPAQSPPSYDRVILGGRVMDPASGLDAIRNIGLLDGRIAVISTKAVRGRDIRCGILFVPIVASSKSSQVVRSRHSQRRQQRK